MLNSTTKDNEILNKQRIETEAFKANEELMDILHAKDSLWYKPWQFADFEVCADTLKTTYEEINIWGMQEAMIRPGFKVEINTVHVPNLFSKIKGVHKELGTYRSELNALIDAENVLFFKKLPICRRSNMKNINKTYNSLLEKDGTIDREKLLTSTQWKYRSLNTATQLSVANKLIDFCTIPNFWKYKNFKVKLHFSLLDRILNLFLSYKDKNLLDEKLMKLSIFKVLMNLDADFLKLLQNFDYSKDIPKIILYNNEKNGKFSFADAIILLFMNFMGIDILIYNPGGTSDIENYVNDYYFDIHQLEELKPHLPYKRNGFFYKLFNR